MKTKRSITFLAIIFLFAVCNGQNKKASNVKNNSVKDTTEHFVIGNYMIVPKLKEIRIFTRTGDVKASGYEYQKDPKINYSKTTLLVIGNDILFKEYFPFLFDVNKLKKIYKDDFWLLYKDNKYIYWPSQSIKPAKIDISGYKPVNDFVYKSKKGTLFFLDIAFLDAGIWKLCPVGIKIDENSIKHIAGNYYYDKNGLYIFGEHSKKSVKGNEDIEKSEKLVNAKNTVPVFSKQYIAFSNQVFAINRSAIKKLAIDAKKMIEVDMGISNESFITDGKSVYTNYSSGYDDDTRNEKGYYGIWYPTLYSGISLQKIYSPLLHFMKGHNAVIFNKNDPNNFPGLIASINNENYLLSNKKKMKIDKMLFYHPETKTTEIFDEKYLKIYKAERFIQYKKVLYFDGIPVETSKFDMENMREIKNSNYLTDGKSLFYIGNIERYGSHTKKGITYAVFDDRIIENAFTKEMKVINPDLLSDGITLVDRGQKIKIKDLNLNVKIIE